MFLLLSAFVSWGREINFPKLHEFIELGDTLAFYKCALVVNVLGFLANEVSACAHSTYQSKTLRSAGKSTNKGSRTLVLPSAYFYSNCVLHNEVDSSTKTAVLSSLPRISLFLRDRFESFYERMEGDYRFSMVCTLSQDD